MRNSESFRRVFLPYCLDRQDDGRYAILNRLYKPVGFTTTEFIAYADHPVLVGLRITEKRAAALSCHGSPDTKRIYLYNDETNPTRSAAHMTAYLSKLAKLAEMPISREAV